MEIVNVSWLPPYHHAGLIDGILQTVYAAKKTILMSPMSFLEKPVRWLRAIAKYRATVSGGPSFGYEYCVRRITDEDMQGLDLSSWVCSVNAAEPIRWDVIQQFNAKFAPYGYDGRGVTPAYGLAEATLLTIVEPRWGKTYCLEVDREKLQRNVVDRPGDGRAVSRLVSHGGPLLDAGLKVVDPVTHIERPRGAVGEVWLSGRSIALGYWGKPELSEQVFRAYTVNADGTRGEGPFLRTGDYGFIGEDGSFFVTGRMKDVIILRGRNHYPQDIEVTSASCNPAFANGGAAAFAIQQGDEEAFVVVQEVRRGVDPAMFESALIAARDAIVGAHGIVPFDIVLVERGSVPKTSSGKTERFKAREQYRAGTLEKLASLRETVAHAGDDRAEEQKLRRKIERRMLAWIAEYADLDIQSVDREAPFERFGVDSVRVAELVRHVETGIDAKVPDSAVLQYKTVASMAAFLAAHLVAPKKSETSETSDGAVDFVLPIL